MIVNVIDRRKNSYGVDCDAAFEPACQDNKVADATQHIADCNFTYTELIKTTVVEALEAGREMEGSVTVYLYAPGSLEIEYE